MKTLAILFLSLIGTSMAGGVSYGMWLATGLWWVGLAIVCIGVLIGLGIQWAIGKLV